MRLLPRPGSPGPATRPTASGRPARRTASRLPRPSLLLWRHRHLVVALCLGGAVLLALGALHPAAQPGQEVLVVARDLDAGEALTQEDVERRSLPHEALPASGLAGEEVIGLRTTIALEPGTVLTTSMTSAGLTRELEDEERVVQVPVEVGAELAQPGARVDVVGQAPPPPPQDAAVGAASGEEADIPSPAGPSGAIGQSPHRVLSSGARVIAVRSAGEADPWTSGRKVTLVTLAVPASDATLVVGAATNGALGIVLSP